LPTLRYVVSQVHSHTELSFFSFQYHRVGALASKSFVDLTYESFLRTNELEFTASITASNFLLSARTMASIFVRACFNRRFKRDKGRQTQRLISTMDQSSQQLASTDNYHREDVAAESLVATDP
jgi:hypothetical protein